MPTGIFYSTQSGDDTTWNDIDFHSNIVNNTLGSFLTYDGNTSILIRDITPGKNANIISAKLKMFAINLGLGNYDNDTANENIYFEDTVNPVAPTKLSEALALEIRLTSPVAWNAIEHWTTGQWYWSPDFSNAFQSIVNKPNWLSGKNAQIVLLNNGSTNNAFRALAAYDYSSAQYRPEFHVEWSPAETGYGLGTTSADQISFSPKWDSYKRGKKQSAIHNRSRSSKLNIYNYGSYKRIVIETEFLEADRAAEVNSWWDSGTKVQFHINSGNSSGVYSMMIMNESTPFAQYNKPHTDRMTGRIELEGY